MELELERAELADLLDRAMALLPPETRLVLVERLIEQIPQAEVALRLGLSEGAVEARLHRGKLALRRRGAAPGRPEHPHGDAHVRCALPALPVLVRPHVDKRRGALARREASVLAGAPPLPRAARHRGGGRWATGDRGALPESDGERRVRRGGVPGDPGVARGPQRPRILNRPANHASNGGTAMVTGSAAPAETFRSATAAESADEDPFLAIIGRPAAKIMLLGTFHFQDAGRDRYKPQFHVDILLERRQREVEEVVDRLAAFEPMKVAVEFGAKYQESFDREYEAYLGGDFELPANEIYQVDVAGGPMEVDFSRGVTLPLGTCPGLFLNIH
ncbi:MAG: sigma-70 family RNA polymerase sigma factor [Chloroflexi bacterium]|nr:sigma-70 family RNA polymerase sigma factor [Chloroflexota bacterium]